MLRSRWFIAAAACMYAAALVLYEVFRTPTFEVLTYAGVGMFVVGTTGNMLSTGIRTGFPLALSCAFGLASGMSGLALMAENYLGLYQTGSPGFYSFYVSLIGFFACLTAWRVQENKTARKEKNKETTVHTRERSGHGDTRTLRTASSGSAGRHQAQSVGQ